MDSTLEAHWQATKFKHIVQDAHEVLKSIANLHNHNVMHRDIKCKYYFVIRFQNINFIYAANNFLMTSDGAIKIPDFGNSSIDHPYGKSTTTTPNALTPPEMLMKYTQYTKKVDSYGVGMVEILHQMFFMLIINYQA